MSWIHETDLNRLFERALVDSEMQGTYIASAPAPASQRDFMRALRRAVGMPVGLPAPAWLVRFGATLLMRTDPDLVLYGRYVIPQRLLEEGFEFSFPRLDAALTDLLSRAPHRLAARGA
jgi:NAD dependent epimerase/dehydratase family enzyme